MLGVLLEALPKKRPLNKRREEGERNNHSLKRKKKLGAESHREFHICPLIRWQVFAGMVPCLFLRRGGLSLQSCHDIFTDGVCENCIVVASSCLALRAEVTVRYEFKGRGSVFSGILCSVEPSAQECELLHYVLHPPLVHSFSEYLI